jgi:hypothetical protein
VAVAAGVLAERRFGARAGRGARGLMRVMLYVLVPPVVFFNVARLEIDANVGLGIAAGWAALTLAGGLAYLVSDRGLRLPAEQAGVVTNIALQANTGYLGFPLVAVLLGSDRLGEAVAYDSLVQTPMLLLGVFGVGAALGTRAGETTRQRLRAFVTRNPPLWATAAALVAPDALAPDALVDASRILVFALLPFGFFAVGVTLAEESDDGVAVFPPPFDRRVAVAVVFRLAIAPALLFALAAPFIELPAPYLLLAAMPAGLNGLVVAHAYGLDLGLQAAAIVWSTIIGLAVAAIAVALL